MKVKRIKLFEAFSNSDKIEKADHLLLCWGVLQFIKDRRIFSKLHNRSIFSLSNEYDDYFFYNPALGNNVSINCDPSLRFFLIDRKIYKSLYPRPAKPDYLQKAVNHVIKKMYEDEKNKAI